ncbi:TOR signaling pathway regulator [Chlorella sorokiniana]|uniref:TOR signaling pathway regulator n=1 Tax=Chlorella sorokiniana TaxID=3076 RepID=A0A2P6TXS3_CHLSO|nr:TOR signaling pathway regulator [Chlorella sorokiniana]|eukprot:PRW58850.1 TOR signaling pathway regulator [Chlorella sorokiniana]
MSDAEELQEVPLKELFRRARSIVKQLEAAPASDPATQSLVARGSECLRAAAAAVDALALFSTNEDRDDLATADIKYLLIPFYQAEVASYTHAADPRVRLAALSSAVQHYRAFLHRCRQYGLLSPPAEALAEVALQQAESGDGGSSSSSGGRVVDATTLRQNKIEKFKREKAIKARIEALEQQEGGGGGSAAGEGDEDERGDGEEAQRELWLLQADLAALQAAERLGSVQQEVAILRLAAAMPEEERQRQREARQAAGPPADLLRQLHAAAGSLSSAAVQRQRLADGVFRPSHVLPTMSVEQFGELEYARMLEQQQREAKEQKRRERAEAEKSAEQKEDEELRKAREWDEFKDDNPRGWGNSKLRPCA